MLAAEANRGPELLHRHDQVEKGSRLQGAVRCQPEDREGQMTDVSGFTSDHGWRASSPRGGHGTRNVDYKALGDAILHSYRSMVDSPRREPERRDVRPATRWRAESAMTWGTRLAFAAVFIAVARVSWYVVTKMG